MSSDIGEIFYRKDKNEWVAYDRSGNSAKGISKAHARNNYLLAFGELADKISVGFDMSKIERTL
jgi:hypothetical protein